MRSTSAIISHFQTITPQSARRQLDTSHFLSDISMAIRYFFPSPLHLVPTSATQSMRVAILEFHVRCKSSRRPMTYRPTSKLSDEFLQLPHGDQFHREIYTCKINSAEVQSAANRFNRKTIFIGQLLYH